MLMMCDQAGAILGVMSEETKNYVMGGEDRVMSWSNVVAQRFGNIAHYLIDGLPGGDALRRREAGKGIHYKGRKSEENSSHRPAAESRETRQSEE
jgi:hypothetical protein